MNIVVKQKTLEYDGKLWQENKKLHIEFDKHHWTVNASQYVDFLTNLENNSSESFYVGSQEYKIRKV